jgi:hypothetical protein
MRDDEPGQQRGSDMGAADGPAELETGTLRIPGQAGVTVAVDGGNGSDAGPTDAELDEVLDAAMRGVMKPDGDESSAGVSGVLIEYRRSIASPRTLDHARARLTSLEAAGDSENAAAARRIVDIIEKLQADPDQLAEQIRLVEEFQATMDALNAFVGASSIEAAYDVLVEWEALLTTDLAVELLEGKVVELLEAGNEEAGRELERGPMRLARDAQVHGAVEGYQVFLARDREQDAAQARLGFLMASMDPEVIAAVDTVLGAQSAEQLEDALLSGYALLVTPEAVMMLDEAATITRVAGTSDDEVERQEYLAAVLNRLSALAHDVEAWPVREQILLALYPVTND